MKIKTVHSFNELDYRGYYAVYVNGDRVVCFVDGEPEDANMSRDFNDVYSIPDLMKMAYEAGKNGEDWEWESLNEDWENI